MTEKNRENPRQGRNRSPRGAQIADPDALEGCACSHRESDPEEDSRPSRLRPNRGGWATLGGAEGGTFSVEPANGAHSLSAQGDSSDVTLTAHRRALAGRAFCKAHQAFCNVARSCWFGGELTSPCKKRTCAAVFEWYGRCLNARNSSTRKQHRLQRASPLSAGGINSKPSWGKAGSVRTTGHRQMGRSTVEGVGRKFARTSLGAVKWGVVGGVMGAAGGAIFGFLCGIFRGLCTGCSAFDLQLALSFAAAGTAAGLVTGLAGRLLDGENPLATGEPPRTLSGRRLTSPSVAGPTRVVFLVPLIPDSLSRGPIRKGRPFGIDPSAN
jgi:hypothetical protein